MNTTNEFPQSLWILVYESRCQYFFTGFAERGFLKAKKLSKYFICFIDSAVYGLNQWDSIRETIVFVSNPQRISEPSRQLCVNWVSFVTFHALWADLGLLINCLLANQRKWLCDLYLQYKSQLKFSVYYVSRNTVNMWNIYPLLKIAAILTHK